MSGLLYLENNLADHAFSAERIEVLEVLAARRLFLVDAYTSNLSVAYDEARELGLRAARRQIAVDPGRGDEAQRASWGEVVAWAERRGEVIVIAHGGPLTARLLREYIPRWEARGLGAEVLLVTEKDWVKMAPHARTLSVGLPIWRLQLDVRFEAEDGEKLMEQIRTRLKLGQS